MAPSQWQFAHADSHEIHHRALPTMDWVAQSGDTLNGLAHSFYPKQAAMQRLFVRQALKLNPHRHLTATTPLVNGESIVLPSLKALSYASRVHGQSTYPTANSPSPNVEGNAGVVMAPTSQETYEQLLARNLKVQQELAEVLDKQVRLQAQMNALMVTLQQQSNAIQQTQAPVADPIADKGALASPNVPELPKNGISAEPSATDSQSATANASGAPAKTQQVDSVSSPQSAAISPAVNADAASATAADKVADGHTKNTDPLPSGEATQTSGAGSMDSTMPTGSQQFGNQQPSIESAEKPEAASTNANPVKSPIKKSTVVIRPVKATQASESNAYAQWFQFNSWSDMLLWLGLLMLVLLLVGAGVVQLKKKLATREAAEPQSDWQPSILELVNVNDDEPVAKKSRMDKRVQSLLSQVGILISANKESEAQIMLEKFIQLYPKQSVFPWLYLLELHRSNGQQEAFAQVVGHLHTTFNVEKADWKDEDSAMVVESQLDAFPHIILELERIWKTDDATQYLKDLQLDKRGGERQGFSLEVLKEIAVLQNVLEIRALQSQAA